MVDFAHHRKVRSQVSLRFDGIGRHIGAVLLDPFSGIVGLLKRDADGATDMVDFPRHTIVSVQFTGRDPRIIASRVWPIRRTARVVTDGGTDAIPGGVVRTAKRLRVMFPAP